MVIENDVTGTMFELETDLLAGSILTGLNPDRSDPSTISYAVSRTREARAHLTVLCVWRPTRWLWYAAESGENPAALLKRHEQSAAMWFRSRLTEVPSDICLRALFLQGLLARELVKELRTTHYDELILDHRLRPWDVARVRQMASDLKVIVL